MAASLDDDDAAWLLRQEAAIRAAGGAEVILGIVKHKADIEVRPARDRDDVTMLPPCLQAVADELERGGSPGHMARFALASFLLKRDTPVDVVHSFFKNASNYVEAMTTKQIESVVRRSYAPPSCQKMKDLKLCREDDICRERDAQTPLAYPRSASA